MQEQTAPTFFFFACSLRLNSGEKKVELTSSRMDAMAERQSIWFPFGYANCNNSLLLLSHKFHIGIASLPIDLFRLWRCIVHTSYQAGFLSLCRVFHLWHIVNVWVGIARVSYVLRTHSAIQRISMHSKFLLFVLRFHFSPPRTYSYSYIRANAYI